MIYKQKVLDLKSFEGKRFGIDRFAYIPNEYYEF